MLTRVSPRKAFAPQRVGAARRSISAGRRTSIGSRSRNIVTHSTWAPASSSSLPGSAQWLMSQHHLPYSTAASAFRRLAITTGARSPYAISIGARTASTFSVTPMGYNRKKDRSKSTAAASTIFEDSEEEDNDDEAYTGGNVVDGKAHVEEWMINLGRDNGEIDAWLTGARPDDWWTGPHPKDCPGLCSDDALRSLPLPNLSNVTRASAREYFDNSWALYETMFAGLKGEDPFYRPPVHGLRHPQIFYYGHVPCLYVNKLRVSGVLDKPVNAYFESIFEVGVDEMLWDDMHKNDMLWPTVAEVHEYRKQVYNTVVDAIETHEALSDDGVLVNQDHPFWALFMGFEHERIHLETSSVLFREMPLHLVQTPNHWPPLHPSATRTSMPSHPQEGVDFPSNAMIPVDADSVDLGKPSNFPSYGWDNEYGERLVDVPAFEASEHMITNGEFWHFVADGGYRNKEYWCDDGWSWRTHRNMKWPFFWQPCGPGGSNEYSLRTIFEVVPMQWDW